MKKNLFYYIPFIFFSFLTVCILPVEAGTLEIGAAGRFSILTSGLAQITADAAKSQMEREMDQALSAFSGTLNAGNVTIDSPEAKGFMGSPVLIYVTDDKKWDFTIMAFVLGKYTSTADASMNLGVDNPTPFLPDISVPISISTELEIKHRDISARAARYFYDMFRVFAGYNYQYYSTDFETSYNANYSPISFNSNIDFSFESHMHMLIFGTGIRLPVKNWFNLDANVSGGAIIGGTVKEELNITGTYYNSSFSIDNGNFRFAFAVIGDVAISKTIAERVDLTLGYQLQYFKMMLKDIDSDGDGVANDSPSSDNLIHNVSLQATYLLNI